MNQVFCWFWAEEECPEYEGENQARAVLLEIPAALVGDGILTAKLYANAKLIEGFQIALDNGRSHGVMIDQPASLGTDLGATALELCVMSHAGCYATIFALTARKMRIALKGLTVKVAAVKTDEVGTVTEEIFDIVIKADLPQNRAQRLHEVTLKNCPVGLLFEKASVKTFYNIQLSKE